MVSPETPIIIGVGQFVDRIDSPNYQAMGPADIAAAAAENACEDALSLADLRHAIDAIATTRTFEDSGPFMPAHFGKANNFPRAVAKRLAIDPKLAVWAKAGGNSPQDLINDFCERIASGEVSVALLAGGETISTVRHLLAKGESRNFAETASGSVEDHGPGLKGLVKRYHGTYKLTGAPPAYALFDNARRKRLGMSREEYALEMGSLFAPFTRVAAENPYSSSLQKVLSPDEIATPSERNRMIADPYTRSMVARDQVNQGAAVLITSVSTARKLGIPEKKWVYLHGYSALVERDIIDREDLGTSPAAQLAAKAALEEAGLTADDIAFFDFYSCFPIAVFNTACDALGLAPDDPRGLTVTGGLPFFGGPGNNYSMHAVASMVEKLRANPGRYGFIGANGGMLSKYTAAVYSVEPADWKRSSSEALQEQLDSQPRVELASEAEGRAFIETYTIVYTKGEPAYAIVIGRLAEGGQRFIANNFECDQKTLAEFVAIDPLEKEIHVCSTAHGNRFSFTKNRVIEFSPLRPKKLRDNYEYCLVERREHVLEITINRPDVRNSLHPMANDELAEIMDAYLADDDLRVAILTGAGTQAFSTGNDLKYSASGKPMWTPKTGFAGLTRRRNRNKPVIAAVNGYALGGGLEICLACDMIVADETAQFGLTEVKVGLIAGAGGLVRLPRSIPKKIASELILTGRRIKASRAYELGLVSSIAAPGTALDVARKLADEVVAASPTSVRLSLEVMQEADEYASEIDAACHESSAIDELFTSEDMYEGMSAFAEKRKPFWKNR